MQYTLPEKSATNSNPSLIETVEMLRLSGLTGGEANVEIRGRRAPRCGDSWTLRATNTAGNAAKNADGGAQYLRELLARYDELETALARVEVHIRQAIEERPDPCVAEAVPRLDTIPGVGEQVAQTMVAEMGVEMARFPRAEHLARWAERFAAQVSAQRNEVAASGGCLQSPTETCLRGRKEPPAKRLTG